MIPADLAAPHAIFLAECVVYGRTCPRRGRRCGGMIYGSSSVEAILCDW